MFQFRYPFLKFFVVSLFLFSLSCSSTNKKASDLEGDSMIESETEPDEMGVTEKELNFQSEESDAGGTLVQTVYFAYDSSYLSAEMREVLAKNASWIRNNQGMSFQLEGHADKRGSVEYNLALGERRAQAVKSYLESLGVDGDRLKTISYGEEKLLSFGDSSEDHKKNRRVNFVVIPL